MSIAGPHLGVGNNHASLLNSGMWVAKKFNHFKAIRQVCNGLDSNKSRVPCYVRMGGELGTKTFLGLFSNKPQERVDFVR